MFKGCHFPRSIIMTAVRRYLRFKLSCWDIEELMAERGVHVDRATVNRWVVKFSPMLLRSARRHCYGASPMVERGRLSLTGRDGVGGGTQLMGLAGKFGGMR